MIKLSYGLQMLDDMSLEEFEHCAQIASKVGYEGLEPSVCSPKTMLMYGKEASNRKQEIDRQHYTIPNQRPKDKHCGKI